MYIFFHFFNMSRELADMFLRLWYNFSDSWNQITLDLPLDVKFYIYG